MKIVPTSVKKFLSKPGCSEFVQTTKKAVITETVLKAVARPTFTMFDDKSDYESRKFSATKEAIYQGTCLGLYLLMIPGFKRVGFKIGKKIFKEDIAFKKFEDYGEFHKLSTKIQREKYRLAKGFNEFNSIIGSVICLTMVAPKVAHLAVPPVMKFLGIEEKGKKEKSPQDKSTDIKSAFKDYKKIKTSA